MILQALTSYYDLLLKKGKIAHLGWAKAKISWGLEIDNDGRLISLMPLKKTSPNKKAAIPTDFILPDRARTSGIKPRFLWDNSSYLLGYCKDEKKCKRAPESFNAAKALHSELLRDVDSDEARAICRFFSNWNPEKAAEDPILRERLDAIEDSDNFIFVFNGKFCNEFPSLCKVWDALYQTPDEGKKMQCLVTGKNTVPAMTHPMIKNVQGAQSSGAALISFNKPSFCSFGREQNLNAPVGKEAATAYTSALNYLLADKTHKKNFGDASVIYWSETAEEAYQDIFDLMLDYSPKDTTAALTDKDLDALMDSILQGKQIDFNDTAIDPSCRFFILGISPNKSRLSVRFFLNSNFGNIVKNLYRHFEDCYIPPQSSKSPKYIPLWRQLKETVNSKSKDQHPLPQLSGDMIKSILNGTRYPQTLYYQIILRIRSEHVVSRAKAGLIKAYLIRNTQNDKNREKIKEVSTVSLNTDSTYAPYVLGQLFATLEIIQRKAIPDISSTIRDRYFNSACATPALVFPTLLMLSHNHLNKLEWSDYWSKQITELTKKLDDELPKHLSLIEQGSFILGYYHQIAKNYEKKSNDTKEEN